MGNYNTTAPQSIVIVETKSNQICRRLSLPNESKSAWHDEVNISLWKFHYAKIIGHRFPLRIHCECSSNLNSARTEYKFSEIYLRSRAPGEGVGTFFPRCRCLIFWLTSNVVLFALQLEWVAGKIHWSSRRRFRYYLMVFIFARTSGVCPNILATRYTSGK